jgi:ZIP family zinc transporter
MDAIAAAAAAAALTWAATAAGAGAAALAPRLGRRGLGVLLAVAAGLMGWAAVIGLGLPAWAAAIAQLPVAAASVLFIVAVLAGAWGVRAIRRRLEGDPHRPVLGRQLFWVMTLHHIPEGLALGLGVAAAVQGDALAAAGAGSLVAAMAVHNAAEGALVAGPLVAEGESRWRAFGRGQLSGLAEVGGALLGAGAAVAAAVLLPWALAAAAGAMAAVVLGDLLPELRAVARGGRVAGA